MSCRPMTTGLEQKCQRKHECFTIFALLFQALENVFKDNCVASHPFSSMNVSNNTLYKDGGFQFCVSRVEAELFHK